VYAGYETADSCLGQINHETLDDAYAKSLNQSISFGGNIAVKLGPVSGYLVAIDFNDDELIETIFGG
jgi:hypothetical protein